MKKTIDLWQLSGFGAVSFCGTVLHFLYDWTGEALLAAPFSGVNESTWEHMKLLFWPAFIFAIVQSFFFRDREGFWAVKLRGILLGITLIPVLFYTYNGAIGRSPDWLNIAIFFISAAIAFLYEARLFNKGALSFRSQRIAFGVLCVIAMLFVIFTFRAPELGIFKDPITGNFGI